MKLITLFALLLFSSELLAQGVIATAPQGPRYVRRPYYGHPQPQAPYYDQAPQQPYPVEGDYQSPQCPTENYPQANSSLEILKQACAQWENHPHRRSGQLAEMKIKLTCSQAVIVSARVETKIAPAYNVVSEPTTNSRPWVKEVTCSEVAQANYNIVALCSAEEPQAPNYPPQPIAPPYK